MMFLNAALLSACVFTFTAHIMISNRSVAQQFSINAKQRELRAVSTRVAAKEAQIADSQNMEKLLTLVRQMEMIANNNAQTLFVDTNVAFLP